LNKPSLFLLPRGDFPLALVESTIGNLNQIAVKPFFRDSGFVATDKQDGLPLGIECECNAPWSIIGLEAKLLHVWVLRALQGIHLRPAKLWTELP
jgi:hypothetical protein